MQTCITSTHLWFTLTTLYSELVIQGDNWKCLLASPFHICMAKFYWQSNLSILMSSILDFRQFDAVPMRSKKTNTFSFVTHKKLGQLILVAMVICGRYRVCDYQLQNPHDVVQNDLWNRIGQWWSANNTWLYAGDCRSIFRHWTCVRSTLYKSLRFLVRKGVTCNC